MPTLKLVTGWNHGSTVAMTTGNTGNRYCDSVIGTPAVVTVGRTGTYCLEISSSAATEAAVFDSGSMSAPGARMVHGFAIRFPTSLPAANVQLVFYLTSDASDDIALTFRSSDSKLVMQKGGINGGTTLAVSASAVAANTWYWIDVDVNVAASTWTGDFKVNGTSAVGQFTQTGKSAQTFVSLNLGSPQTAQTATFRFDDSIVSFTGADYPLGDHHVEQLIPDTGGTATEIGTANATARFTANGTLDSTFNSANILAALSEVPATIGASASGIHQRTSGATNAAEIPMTTYTLVGAETISGVRVVTLGWAATTTAAFMGLRSFNGTTETILQAGTVDPNFDASTTAPAWLCKMATAADFDTQSELNAMTLRLGYSTDVNPVIGYHAVYAEVAVKTVSGQTVAVGLVTETDSTFGLSRQKIKTLGLVTETDKAFRLANRVGRPSEADSTFAITRQKVRTLGLVTETDRVFRLATPVGRTSEADTAQPISRIKIRTLGLTTSANTTFAVGRQKTKALGLITETDTAQPISRVKSKTLGLTTSSNTAQPVSRQKSRTLSVQTETDAVQTITRRKIKILGQPTETDTTFAISVGGSHTVTLGLTTETDTCQTITRRKTKTLGLVTETDTALPVVRQKTRTLTQPSSANIAQPIGRQKIKTLGLITSANTAQSVTRVKTKTLGLITSTDATFALSRQKIRVLGRPTETDLAQPISIGGNHTVAVGQLQETDVCQPITRRKTKILGLVSEADSVLQITRVHRRTLGQPSTTEIAQKITRRIDIGPALETDAALSLVRLKVRSLGRPVETDTVFSLARKKIKSVGLTVEADSALHITIGGLNIPYVINGTLHLQPNRSTVNLTRNRSGLNLQRNIATLDVED